MIHMRAIAVLIAMSMMAGFLAPLGAEEQTNTVDVSLQEVQTLLSSELSAAQVIEKMGTPSARLGGPHPDYINIVPSTLAYRLSGQRGSLSFRCLDKLVVSARYDRTQIPGVGPVTHRLTVNFRRDGQQVWFDYSLGKKRFETYEALKAHLHSLPRSEVVTFMTNDCPNENEPLRTRKELDEFIAFCKAEDVRLIIMPGG